MCCVRSMHRNLPDKQWIDTENLHSKAYKRSIHAVFQRLLLEKPHEYCAYTYLDTAVILVPLAGIELATFALRMRCSTN
jgi:hypothetical protein